MNHKISLWGLMVGILITIHSFGQNINKIEFFVDTDPGIGLATNVPINPILQKQINNLTFNVPVGSLLPGLHKLFIRARGDDGKWSMVFEKTILGATNPLTPQIVRAEYFINTDPGFGSGVNITIPSGQTTLSNINFTIPSGSLPAGTNYLYVRTKDENGKWSEPLMRQLNNVVTPPASAIVKAEYFINTDPGIGLGTNIVIPSGQTTLSNINFTIPSGSLPAGTNYLYIRTKDENGKWSEPLMRQLNNVVTPPVASIVKAEYFINTDPGIGLGTNIVIPSGQTNLSNINFTIPSGSLPAGTNYLYIRTKDESGKWSEPLMRQLNNVITPPAAAIVKAEYFINTDPGIGLGTNIVIPSGQMTLSNINFTIPSGNLPVGTNYLYIRTKDESGKWSEPLMRQLNNVVIPPAASIVKAEYFINTDPGIGLGTNIVIPSGQTTLSNINFTIPSGSLPSGTNYLYIRTKDENGKWSEPLMRQLNNVVTPPVASIVKAEYFINTDPGIGLGTNIVIPSGQTTLSNINFTIPSGSLPAGTNYLYVRTKDENGKWSEPLMRQLNNVVNPPVTSIVKAEYFINTDPGIGLGTNIVIPSGQTTLSNINFTIPSGVLPTGTNYLYVRAKDENGKWSEPLMRQLNNVVTPPVASIVKAEYFINTDPGIGLGTNIVIPSGQTTLSNINFTIPSGSLPSGTNYLYIRTKDENGKWSEPLMRQLNNVVTPPVASIVKAEYFINTDPGIGLGTNIVIPSGQTTLSNINFTIPSGSLPAGTNYLYVRTKDENGKWSEPLMRQLNNVVNPPVTSIVKAEYFINTDPGIGLGTNIVIPSGQTTLSNINFTIPSGVLPTGTNYLYVRAKDENGKWSEPLMRQLNNVVTPPVASIVKAEYFINTDPGIGLGTNIVIPSGQTTLSNINFTIPSGSLPSGTNYLYIRTKDENGKWSEPLMRQLNNVVTPPVASIVKAEYFINTDPGIGLGTNIVIPSGQTTLSNINFTI
ncbi:hypothetical protein, partial [Emticicia agri]